MSRLSFTRRSYAARHKRKKASLGTAALKVVGQNWTWVYNGPDPAGWDMYASTSPVSVDGMSFASTEPGSARSAVIDLGSGVAYYMGLQGYDSDGKILVRSNVAGPVSYP
jgi:hypothetical protein